MNEPQDVILEAAGVDAGYGEQQILFGVGVQVRRGSVVTVLGPNGSGKSTLLKTVYGLVRARAGKITFVGEDGAEHELVGLRPHRITQLGLNVVPQTANVFPEMAVLENLEVGALALQGDFDDQLARVLDVFPMLKGMLKRRTATLSGGQRQMVGIARAMMSNPRLLILDEPSAGLAPRVVEDVFAKVREINGLGVTILIVEQKARQCLAFSDYAYVLDVGRNRYEGTGQGLLDDEKVVDLYLGRLGRSRAGWSEGVQPAQEVS